MRNKQSFLSHFPKVLVLCIPLLTLIVPEIGLADSTTSQDSHLSSTSNRLLIMPTPSPTATPAPTPFESSGSFSPEPGDLVTNPVMLDWSGRTAPQATTEFLVQWYAHSTDPNTGELVPELIGADRTTNTSISASYDNKGSTPGSWSVIALNSQAQQIGYVIGMPGEPEIFQLYGNGPNIKFVKDVSIKKDELLRFNVELDAPAPTPTPALPNTCQGHCGPDYADISFNEQASCWCDRVCEDIGDCCHGWDYVRSYCGYPDVDALPYQMSLDLTNPLLIQRLRNTNSKILETVRQCVRQSLRRYKRSKQRLNANFDGELSKRLRRRMRKHYRKQCVESVNNNLPLSHSVSFRDALPPAQNLFNLQCAMAGLGEVPCPSRMGITEEGTFSYTPEAGDEAEYVVTLIAADPANNTLLDTFRFLLTVYQDEQTGVGPGGDLKNGHTHEVVGGPSMGITSLELLLDGFPSPYWLGKEYSSAGWKLLFKISADSDDSFLIDKIQLRGGSINFPRTALSVSILNDTSFDEDSLKPLTDFTVELAPEASPWCNFMPDSFASGCDYQIHIGKQARYILLEIAGDSQPSFGEVKFNGWQGMKQIPGDFNCDGVVDGADYAVYRRNMNTPADPEAECTIDANGDGFIDLDDYAIWRSHFGQTAE